jgi:hypothetical protein
MKLASALDEFSLRERRRGQGEEGRPARFALAALREYLLDHSGFEESGELRPEDFLDFLFAYYPAQEEPESTVALSLLDASAAFSRWLAEHGDHALHGFAALEERLREEIPRAIEVRELLHAHAHREDLGGSAYLAETENESPVGALETGLDRIARPGEVDYPAAEEDYFTVREVSGSALTLTSPQREALGEPPLGPVPVPAQAAERLRPGDILHAEIAPGPDGWELLEVLSLRPGALE